MKTNIKYNGNKLTIGDVFIDGISYDMFLVSKFNDWFIVTNLNTNISYEFDSLEDIEYEFIVLKVFPEDKIEINVIEESKDFSEVFEKLKDEENKKEEEVYKCPECDVELEFFSDIHKCEGCIEYFCPKCRSIFCQ